MWFSWEPNGFNVAVRTIIVCLHHFILEVFFIPDALDQKIRAHPPRQIDGQVVVGNDTDPLVLGIDSCDGFNPGFCWLCIRFLAIDAHADEEFVEKGEPSVDDRRMPSVNGSKLPTNKPVFVIPLNLVSPKINQMVKQN